MALGLGGSNKAKATGATSVTTGTFATTSGSVLVAAGVADFGITINPFTDNKGNGDATLLASALNHNNSNSRMGYWQNIVGGAGHTVTINASGASNLLVMAIEVTGTKTTNANDGATRLADNATPYTSGTIVTTVADTFLAGFVTSDEFTAVTFTPGNSFTTVQEELVGDSQTGCLAHRIVSATDSYESSFTMTGADGNSKGVWVAAFMAAAVDKGRIYQRIGRPRPFAPGLAR